MDEVTPARAVGAAADRRTVRRWPLALLALLVLAAGLAGLPFQGKLSEVQKNDNSAFLPAAAEASRVDAQARRSSTMTTLPGSVVYVRPAGLTAADRAKVTADVEHLRAVPGVAADQVFPPAYSRDGTAASVQVPLVARTAAGPVRGPALAQVEKQVQLLVKAGNPPGLEAHTAGAGGLTGALIEAFGGIDGTLLLVAGIVVIVLLLVVYRSPVLWFFPLFSAGLSLGLASLLVYQLAKHDVITLNGQSAGILSVLVIGAGTDYALLLVSRYREELHRYDSRVEAMVQAWRGAAPAIAASAATVVIGLLCLLASQLSSNRGLGPVAAIGIGCTLLVMLALLPAMLVLFGRWIFWPRIPRVGGESDLASHGVWGRIAGLVGRRARPSWVAATVVLLALVALAPMLRTGGLSTVQGFTNRPDAVVGTGLLEEKFPSGGGGATAVIATDTAGADAVAAAAAAVPGVAGGPGAVCPQPDFAKVAPLLRRGGGFGGSSAPALPGGCLPAALAVAPIDGRTLLNARLASGFDSAEALATVQRLRAAVHAVPGAHALVGGQSAFRVDVQAASRRDRTVILPLVLLVIFVVLALLLRALLAPLLLILTVVLSFAATLGVCAVVFNSVFYFPDADPAFPLFAFIFLVALGIDYNIFLMTRVREEALAHGTRSGVLRGLAVTGGVITSAGIVLASTFAVLGVLPLVFLAEIGFAVAFGVLLDTLLVRSVLVPALAHDLGRVLWWPSRLSRAQP